MKPVITDISQLDLTKTYTYADYLTWQFDEMIELFRGKIQRMSPAPLRIHQKIVHNLSGKFYTFFKTIPCDVYEAPFDVRLFKTEKDDKKVMTVVQPDISIICDKSKLDDRGCLGSPDLIVEILSKTSEKRDIHDKYDLYEETSVREYWIVDPEVKTVDIFVLEEEKYISCGNFYEKTDTFKSSIFPEMDIKRADIFTE